MDRCRAQGSCKLYRGDYPLPPHQARRKRSAPRPVSPLSRRRPRGPLQLDRIHLDQKTPRERVTRHEAPLHAVCGAPEPQDADADAPFHPADERVQQKREALPAWPRSTQLGTISCARGMATGVSKSPTSRPATIVLGPCTQLDEPEQHLVSLCCQLVNRAQADPARSGKSHHRRDRSCRSAAAPPGQGGRTPRYRPPLPRCRNIRPNRHWRRARPGRLLN